MEGRHWKSCRKPAEQQGEDKQQLPLSDNTSPATERILCNTMFICLCGPGVAAKKGATRHKGLRWLRLLPVLVLRSSLHAKTEQCFFC